MFHTKWQCGYKIRRLIHRIATKLGPIFRFILPNFRAAHYFYIICMVFIGSWTIFPCHNLKYIDTLFYMLGAATQAGLNTVDTNNIYLYQQIMIYLITTTCTPIFIHGLLLFVRLYWFEREFDNIKEKLTLNHKMRRYYLGDTEANTQRNQGIGMQNSPSPSLSGTAEGPAEKADNHDHDVTFGDLPTPLRRERDPAEMYRLIAMMQQNHQAEHDTDDSPLVVRPPNEIERGDGNIFRPNIPRRKLFTGWKKRRFSKIKHSFTNEESRIRRTFGGDSHDNIGDGDENVLIDSEAVSSDSDDDEEHQPDRSRDRTHTDRAHTDRSTDNSDLKKVMLSNYLSWTPTIGRNSQFYNLTDEQKEELGGVEYRATKLLLKVVVVYYVGFHLICLFMFLGWINMHPDYAAEMRAQGISPNWWAAFTAQLSFNDLGITLTNNSMNSYLHSIYVLLVALYFVVIGNTAFPVLLRFIVWVMKLFAPKDGQLEELLGFLLDHPRRCFTLLFPLGPTWWLFFTLVVLNGVDLMLFMVLDLKNPMLDDMPQGIRVVNGLFQAFSTRTAGFSSVDLSQLHDAVQVLYVIMMYISVLPIAVTIRRTNVYEEQLLGLYGRPEHDHSAEDSPRHYIGQHLRNQLSFDLWFIFLGLFIICICENGKLEKNEVRFSVWLILFEVVLAYGTVGMLLGYPDVNTSLSGKFTVLSKLVIIACMIRGRHRGLPYTLDRAIMLPSSQMAKRDEIAEAEEIRRNATLDRTTSSHSNNRILPDLNFLTRMITGEGPMYHRLHHHGHRRAALEHRPEPFLFVPGRPIIEVTPPAEGSLEDLSTPVSTNLEEDHSASSITAIPATPGYHVVKPDEEDDELDGLRKQVGHKP